MRLSGISLGDFEDVDDYGNTLGLNPDGTIPDPNALSLVTDTATADTTDTTVDPATLMTILLFGFGMYFLMKGGR